MKICGLLGPGSLVFLPMFDQVSLASNFIFDTNLRRFSSGSGVEVKWTIFKELFDIQTSTQN